MSPPLYQRIAEWLKRSRGPKTIANKLLSAAGDRPLKFLKHMIATSNHNQNMSILSKIKDGFKDIATLDVATVTGTIQLTNTADGISWESLVNDDASKIQSANLNVVAFTHSQWDCDSVNFVKEELTPGEQELLLSHQNTVTATHETRRKAVEMLLEIGGLD